MRELLSILMLVMNRMPEFARPVMISQYLRTPSDPIGYENETFLRPVDARCFSVLFS